MVLAVFHGCFQCLDGAWPPNKKRNNHVWKDNDVAQRKERESVFWGKGWCIHGKPLFEMFLLQSILAQIAEKQGFCVKKSLKNAKKLSKKRVYLYFIVQI